MNARWTLALLVGMVIGWLPGCGSAPPPIPENAFTDVELTLLADGRPLPDEITVTQSQGVFAELRLKPRSPLPETYHDRPVQSPDKWPIVVFYYPSGYKPNAPDFYSNRWHRFRRPREKGPVDVLAPGTHDGWREAGFTGPPPTPADMQTADLRFWTYLAGWHDKPGRYDYRVVAYPTSHTPEGRSLPKFGMPVFLWQGVMNVVESAGAE